MHYVCRLEEAEKLGIEKVGGKTLALARMYAGGFRVPDAVCITSDSYCEFLESDGLRDKIFFELSRKDFSDMRWEELWNAALRIRNIFTTFSHDRLQHCSLPGRIPGNGKKCIGRNLFRSAMECDCSDKSITTE